MSLVGAYQEARRELARAREAAAAAAEAFLEADAALVARLGREGEVAVGRSLYSAGPDGHLRWRPRPTHPENWRNYITTPSPEDDP